MWALPQRDCRQCDQEMIYALKKIPLISSYVEEKSENEKVVLTNIGILREYITRYLNSYEYINKEQTILVRQLEGTSQGIIFEVYAFTTATDLITFEKIQADIFDHIYTILPIFNLRLYQNPSSYDMQQMIKNL